MDDDGSGCDCLPDCEGVSYEAHVDSRTVDAEVECGGEHGSSHVALALYTDPFSIVQQVMKERLKYCNCVQIKSYLYVYYVRTLARRRLNVLLTVNIKKPT